MSEDLRTFLHATSLAMSVGLMLMALGAQYLVNSTKHSVWWRFKRMASKLLGMCVRQARARGSTAGSSSHVDSYVNEQDIETAPRRVRDAAGYAVKAPVSPAQPSASASPSEVTSRRGRVERVQLRHQSLLSSWLIALILCFALSSAGYSILFLRGAYRWQRRPVVRLLDFLVASATTCLFCGMWVVAYKWYDSIPSISRYGRLFGVNSCLIRYPWVFFRWCEVMQVFTFLSLQLLLFVLPQALPDKSKLLNELSFYVLAGNAVFWLGSMTFLVALLHRVFEKSREAVAKGSARKPGPKAKAGRERAQSASTGARTERTMSTDSLERAVIEAEADADARGPAATDDGVSVARRSSAGEDASRGDDLLREYKRMQRTFTCTLIWAWILVSLAGFLLIGSVLYTPFKENLYITVSLLVITAELGASMLLFFVIYRPLVPSCC